MQHGELLENFERTVAKAEALEDKAEALEELCDELEAECHSYREKESNEAEATDRMIELQQTGGDPDPADAEFEKRWMATQKAVEKWTKKAELAQDEVTAKDSLLVNHAAAMIEKDRLLAAQAEEIVRLRLALQETSKKMGEAGGEKVGENDHRRGHTKDKAVAGVRHPKVAEKSRTGQTERGERSEEPAGEQLAGPSEAKRRAGLLRGEGKGKGKEAPRGGRAEKDRALAVASTTRTKQESKRDRKKTKNKEPPPKEEAAQSPPPISQDGSPVPGRVFHVGGDGWVLDERSQLPPTTPERAPTATERKSHLLLGKDGSQIQLRVWEDSGETFLTLVHRGEEAATSVILPWSLWGPLHATVQACLDRPLSPQSHVLTAGIRSFTFQYTPQAQVAIAELQPRRLTPVVIPYALCGDLTGRIAEFRSAYPPPLSPAAMPYHRQQQQQHHHHHQYQHRREGGKGAGGGVPRKKYPREKKEKNEADELAKKPCFRCRQRGHRARDCPQAKTCYNCNKEGHIGSDCPLPPAVRCVVCKEVGHKASECPSATG